MKKEHITAINLSDRNEWPELYMSSKWNTQTSLRLAPNGKLHLISRESTIDGKRFGTDEEIDPILEKLGIERHSSRHGILIIDRIVDSLTATKFCLEDSIPEKLLKFVHIH